MYLYFLHLKEAENEIFVDQPVIVSVNETQHAYQIPSESICPKKIGNMTICQTLSMGCYCLVLRTVIQFQMIY